MPIVVAAVVHRGRAFSGDATVGDSPRGPLKQRGNPHLKPATKQNTPSLTMQVPNHEGDGPRRWDPDGPSRRPS
jgi:hypothetical protein